MDFSGSELGERKALERATDWRLITGRTEDI